MAFLELFSGSNRGDPVSPTNPIPTVPGATFDPIFDHANSTKNSVTTSLAVITPPAGCSFVRIDTDADIVINTANAAATDGATTGGTRIVANSPEIVPVTAGVAVRALSLSGTAVVRCTPLKNR